MKKYLLYQALNLLVRGKKDNEGKRWLKKAKYFFAFAFLFFLLVGGFAVWGTVKVVNHFAASLSNLEVNMPADPLVAGKETLTTLVSRPITTQACLNQAVGLLSPVRWLTVSIDKNISSLVDACLGSGGYSIDKKTENN